MTSRSVAQIKQIRQSPEFVRSIHYSCESWYTVKDRPVAISCISVGTFTDRGVFSFSQSDFKERSEEVLLEKFYEHIRSIPDAIFVHWNMNSSDFGFEAINNRWRFLTGKEPPYRIPVDRVVDLDELLGDTFGSGYIDHPKFSSILLLNSFTKRFILTGKEESEKFTAGDHGDIKRSTTEKALGEQPHEDRGAAGCF